MSARQIKQIDLGSQPRMPALVMMVMNPDRFSSAVPCPLCPVAHVDASCIETGGAHTLHAGQPQCVGIVS